MSFLEFVYHAALWIAFAFLWWRLERLEGIVARLCRVTRTGIGAIEKNVSEAKALAKETAEMISRLKLEDNN